MRLASTVIVAVMCGACVTGVTGGIPLEYTAILNSSLEFKYHYDRLEDETESETERILAAVAETAKSVARRYSEIADSYLDLIDASSGDFAFTQEIEEVLETVRQLERE